MWCAEDILEQATQILRDEELRLQQEQAVHGLDRSAEVALHELLARGFAGRGLGAFRERVYPCAPIPRSRLTERQRCDLVLTAAPSLPPIDPDELQRAAAASAGTLFGHADPAVIREGCPAEHAFWLELKLVGQFTFSRGVPVPNAAYCSELSAGLSSDLEKLAADPMICHGAAMLILFSVDRQTAEHDLRVLHDRAARRGAPRPFLSRGFAVPDRIGNRRCTVALVPVR